MDHDWNNQPNHVSFSSFYQQTLLFRVFSILKQYKHYLPLKRKKKLQVDWSSSHLASSWPPWEPSEVIAPESYPPHVRVRRPHCKDLCIPRSVEERDSIVPAPRPRGSQRDLLHGCGFTVKHLSLCADCVSGGRKSLSGIYWQLWICRWWTNAPLEHRSCKRKRVEYPLKMVFISFKRLVGCVCLPRSLYSSSRPFLRIFLNAFSGCGGFTWHWLHVNVNKTTAEGVLYVLYMCQRVTIMCHSHNTASLLCR